MGHGHQYPNSLLHTTVQLSHSSRMGAAVLLLLIAVLSHQALTSDDVCKVSIALQHLDHDLKIQSTNQMEEWLEIKAMVTLLLQNNQRDQSKTSAALQKLDMKMEQVQSVVQLEPSESIQESCSSSTNRVCDAVKSISKMVPPANLLKLASGVYYMDLTKKMSYSQAKRYCNYMDMEMVILKNLSEIEPLRQKLPEDKWVRLAGTDAGRATGDFFWEDGTPVAMELWHKSPDRKEPDNVQSGQTTCVYLWSQHHSLGDWKCDDANAALLCRLPRKYSACFV